MEWRAGWAMIHSPAPDDLHVRGVFRDEQAVHDSLRGQNLGRPGPEVFVAFPITRSQLERLSSESPDLAPVHPLVDHARTTAFGRVRLMTVAAQQPLWLGERSSEGF